MANEQVDNAYIFIMAACTKAKISSGVARKHPRSIGVTFTCTHEQWQKFYDLVTDEGYEIQGVKWNEVGKSKNQPLYFYDFSIKVA